MAHSRPNASKSRSNKNLDSMVSQWLTIPQKYLIYLFFLSTFSSTACLWQFESGHGEWPLLYQANIHLIILKLYFFITSKTIVFITFTKIHFQTLHSYVGFSRELSLKKKLSNFPSLGQILSHSFHMPLKTSFFSPFPFNCHFHSNGVLHPYIFPAASLQSTPNF